MQNYSKFCKHFIGFLLVVFLLVGFNVNSALAHRPHDVISQVKISPNFERDRTIFVIVRNNLFKSADGGDSWQRITKGIDHLFFTDLSSLEIFSQNPQILFLASPENGIYKSQDGGQSWQKLNQGLENLQIDLVAISPKDDNLVIAADQEKGLYRTDNGGNQWRLVLANSTKITAIAFSPHNEKQVIIGDRQGNLYLSNDGGETWQQQATIKDGGEITALAISPNKTRDNTFYVGTENSGIFKTVDGGKSLVSIEQGVSDKYIEDIVILEDDSAQDIVWISTWNEGAFQSVDSGKTWTKFSQGLTKESQADSMKSPHFTDLSISPAFSRDKTMFLGGFDGLFKSTDGGRIWQEIETLSLGTITSMAVSPNYQNDSTIAIVTYVGSVDISRDGGKTWQRNDRGLEVPRLTRSFQKPAQDPRRFFDVAFSPNYGSDREIFATILWENFLKSNDGGLSWQIISLPNTGDALRGMSIVPSPNYASDRTIYVATQYGTVFISKDGGQTFKFLSRVERNSTNEPISLAISPNFTSDRTLYVSGKEGVHKTVDGGVTWQVTSQKTPLAETYRAQVAISPNYSADQTVVAGTEKGLFITQDGGESWQELKSNAYGEKPYIESVAISPNYQNDRTFIVSTRGRGLFKTSDGGANFTKIGNDALALARMTDIPSAGIPIQFSPNYGSDRTIYGFGSARTEVYKSTDGGNSWEIIAVPNLENEQYNLWTWLELNFYVYRSPILKSVAALILGIFSYFLLAVLPLDKILPLKKSTIAILGSLAIFMAALIILLK